ncbi:MAG: hypothetical protein JSV66_00050, partial [Trueperaceae bacterium]
IKHMFRLPLDYRTATPTPIDGVPGFAEGFDLLKDGRIVLLPTPGHTRGHQSVLIRGAREVLLTADIAYDREALEKNLLPGSLSDPKLARESLSKIATFTAENPSAILQFGHDPDTWRQTSQTILALNEPIYA